METVRIVVLLAGGGAFLTLCALSVAHARGQLMLSAEPPNAGAVAAGVLMGLGSVLLGSFLLHGGLEEKDRAWFEGGDHLLDAPVNSWLAGAPADQLAAAAALVFTGMNDDEGFDISGPQFMTDAADLRSCMIRLASTGSLNPDTPTRNIGALCWLSLLVSEEDEDP